MLELLRTFSANAPGAEDRVLRCLVFLSRGKWDALERELEIARLDWRDTIVAAEYEPVPGAKRFQNDCVRVRDFSQPFV